jgi:hypothetical protein
MTEAEWLACDDPRTMLRIALTTATDRKLRLFACASLEAAAGLGEVARQVIELGERLAEARASERQMELAPLRALPDLKTAFTTIALWQPIRAVIAATLADQLSALSAESPARDSAVIRCVFGNPFRPAAAPASMLPRWRTADVLGLAAAIYDDRAFERLPLLADALMDAGCADEPILAHCRSPGPHVRGCWVVDLALGKE